jgi:hypothetical protein
MNRRSWITTCLCLVLAANCWSQEDPGKTKLGMVHVSVYFATDGDADAAGPKATPVAADISDRLSKEQRLKFKHYRLIGEDTKPLYRSYENWAEPLKPSDEVMVRFEAQSEPKPDLAIIGIELWLSRKKTIKTNARLEGNKPLFVLGPKWRGGQLIIAIALAESKATAPNPTTPHR